MGMFTYAAHGGAPPMSKADCKFSCLVKNAELCGFSGRYLRFVKTLCTTIKGKGARVNTITNGAPFLLRDVCCARVSTHKREGLQGNGSLVTAHDDYGSDGHICAFAALFMGGV